MYPSEGMLQDQVLATLQTANWRGWQTGGPRDWAENTHQVAIQAVYLFPSSLEIDERYVGKSLPVIHEQLAKAAVRLAGVLNRTLGQN